MNSPWIDEVRDAVRSIPALDRALRPVVAAARWPVRTLYRRRLRRFRALCAGLPQRLAAPVFVKVGAHDGVTGDPCSDLLLADPRWRGVLIEPVPHCCERLRQSFADRGRFAIEQLVIAPCAGEVSFFYVDPAAREEIPGLPPWFDALGSLDRAHVARHLGGVLEPYIRELTVEAQPLSAVLARHGIRAPALLHVDAEGSDDAVLASLDLAAVTPLVVFVEHKHLPRERKRRMRRRLRRHGYTVSDCGRDDLAVAKRWPESG